MRTSGRAHFAFCVALAGPTPPDGGRPNAASNVSGRKVSGSFYKRPSAAIERGGGFFVPGLEGERLPSIVGGVTGTLLAINWASTAAETHTVSAEISSLTACLGVLALIVGGRPQADSEDSQKKEESSSDSSVLQEASAESQTPHLNAENRNGQSNDEGRLQEILDVAVDLSAAQTAIAVKWQSEVGSGLKCVSGSVSESCQVIGAVVERVGAEGKGVYISDLTSLPPDIGIPILPETMQQGSAVVEPISADLVAVVASPVKDAFSAASRAWMGVWLASPSRT